MTFATVSAARSTSCSSSLGGMPARSSISRFAEMLHHRCPLGKRNDGLHAFAQGAQRRGRACVAAIEEDRQLIPDAFGEARRKAGRIRRSP